MACECSKPVSSFRMRKLGVYAVVIAVLAVAVAAGWAAADWPRLCTRLGWCRADFPRMGAALSVVTATATATAAAQQ